MTIKFRLKLVARSKKHRGRSLDHVNVVDRRNVGTYTSSTFAQVWYHSIDDNINYQTHIVKIHNNALLEEGKRALFCLDFVKQTKASK